MRHLMQMLAVALLCSIGTAAVAVEQPPWQRLVFEKRSIWGTARGEITVNPVARKGTDLLEINVVNSVGSSYEVLDLVQRADSGAVLSRSRLSKGRNARLKTYLYDATQVLRERREPPAQGAGEDPAGWPATGTLRVPYPAAQRGRTVIAAHSLFALFPTLAANPQQAENYLLHTDQNFYTLSASAAAQPVRLKSKATVDGEVLSGEQRCLALTLRVTPLPGNPDKDDLELMGLASEITVLINEATGLPLQLRGSVPRIGSSELNLVEASLATAAAHGRSAAASAL